MILAMTIALVLPSAVEFDELERRIAKLEQRLDELEERGAPPEWDDWLKRDWVPHLFSRRRPKGGVFNFELPGGRSTWLGVELGQLTADEAKEAGVRWGEGVAIRRTVPGSPADRSGLREGDVILDVDGERVGTPEELAREVRSREPGEEVTVGISREGVRSEVAVVLGEHGPAPEIPGLFGRERRARTSASLDVSSLHLTDELVERMDLTEEERAKVEEVLEGARRELVEELSRGVNEGERFDFGVLSEKLEELERDVERKLSRILNVEQMEEYRRSSEKKSIRLRLKVED